MLTHTQQHYQDTYYPVCACLCVGVSVCGCVCVGVGGCVGVCVGAWVSVVYVVRADCELFFLAFFLDTTPVLEVPNRRAPVGR